MDNRVGEVVDEVDGLGHVHRRLQLVLLRQLQQLPGERIRWEGKKIMAGPYLSWREKEQRRKIIPCFTEYIIGSFIDIVVSHYSSGTLIHRCHTASGTLIMSLCYIVTYGNVTMLKFYRLGALLLQCYRV